MHFFANAKRGDGRESLLLRGRAVVGSQTKTYSSGHAVLQGSETGEGTHFFFAKDGSESENDFSREPNAKENPQRRADRNSGA